jgi:hypothetical protein
VSVSVSVSVCYRRTQVYLFNAFDANAASAFAAAGAAAKAGCGACTATLRGRCNSGTGPFNTAPYTVPGWCASPEFDTYVANLGCSCNATDAFCAAAVARPPTDPCLLYRALYDGSSTVETPPMMTSDPFATFATNLTAAFDWVTRLIVTDATAGTAGSRAGGLAAVSRWGLYAAPASKDALGNPLPPVRNASRWAAVTGAPAWNGSGFLGGFNPRVVERVTRGARNTRRRAAPPRLRGVEGDGLILCGGRSRAACASVLGFRRPCA